jgi:biopolymer transport protein ExbD
MRRNAAFTTGGEESGQQIDLTPMLDVVFIMLIFFIVTASFIKEAGIDVARPEAVTAEKKKNAKILVAVSPTNEIWIDKKNIDKRSVKATIERLLAENPKGGLVIQADNKSNAETVAAVMDAARDAGVVNVSLSATEK